MADATASLEAIRQDIACPACLYNLRGLRGAVVNCPECGQSCDIAQLVARRWTKAWYKAPGFNRVLLPTVWAYLSLVVVAIASMQRAWGFSIASLPTLMVTLPFLAIWCMAMVWAWHLFEDVRGVVLPLLAHAILGGYLFGLLGLIGAIFQVINVLIAQEYPSAVMPAIWGLVCAGMLMAARRGERYIAQQCIKRYLAVGPTS